jgi:exopolyphosphatase/guanosine-5'-triphosphate,3'-diphosphate pyrophosphatase
LAVIDVGSNSCHMVVADVARDGGIQVVDRLKETVRLGRRSFLTGRLDPEAMELGASAVRTFCRLARACGVERIRAVATSAVREARNGRAFVEHLRRETGLGVRIISGDEEARLIFRAARHAFGLDGGPHLVLDMGGGSAELVLVQNGRPIWLKSLPLGAVRLSERFLSSDPPTARQLRRLERHLDRVLGPTLLPVRHAGVQRVIGTSGTVNHLVALARGARGEEPMRLHGVRATAAEISRLRRRVVGLDAERRAALPGMDTKRVDLVPAAAVLVDYVLTHAGSPELVACGWALREGLLLDLVDRVVKAPARNNVRRRSVEALAARLGEPAGHGRQVARLALALFDALAPTLRLPERSRELLEYSALLHDVGRVIDHDRHHRHSSYLIRNSELLGFEPDEIAVMAEVARGHRKQVPKAASPELRALSPSVRRTVRGLAALVRLADGLDRTKASAVDGLEVRLTPKRLLIQVDAKASDAELELWAAERRGDLLARLLERPVELRLVRPAVRLAARAR